jgi:DNA-binding NtrC family response regulator
MDRHILDERASRVDECDWNAAACSNVPVLITSGRREERKGWARSIHQRGSCRDSVFVHFDCATEWAPRDAGDSIGHFHAGEVRRAFGAAAGGTLFIDRIELLPPAGQRELFSQLEHGVRDDAGAFSVQRRVRIITGASKSVLGAIVDGSLDASLFYRLNTIHLDLTKAQPQEEQAIDQAEGLQGPPTPADR